MHHAVCQRLSFVRSDDHPTNRIDASPTQYGSAEIKLTVRFEAPDNFFTMVGSQKPNPYSDVTMKKYPAASRITSRFLNA